MFYIVFSANTGV